MTTLVVLTVVVIAALIAGLALYLFWVGSLLGRIATNLEACEESVQQINRDAEKIGPGLAHINRSAGTVSGALPLLYGFAERIVAKAGPNVIHPEIALPASGTRRSRLHEAVGFRPHR